MKDITSLVATDNAALLLSREPGGAAHEGRV